MKKYEILGEAIFEENMNDFAKCEGLWQEIGEGKAFSFIKSAYDISVSMNDEREYLKEDRAREILDSGELILLPVFWLREKNDNPKCPICGCSYTDYPALSRIDNKTHICPKCGTKEAISHFSKKVDI